MPTLKADFLPNFQGDEGLGIKADAQGSYAESGAAPQSALTPVISAIKASGSTFVYAGSTPQNTILLEREAKLQGANSVKVWACNSGCYDSSFYRAGRVGRQRHLRAAATTCRSTPSTRTTRPWRRSSSRSAAPPTSTTTPSSSYVMCAAVPGRGAEGDRPTAEPWTAQSLFTALNGELSFDADDIIGPTNVGGHQLSNCDVITQLVNGQWQRVYPTKPGTFDCKSGNTKTIKMNVTL